MGASALRREAPGWLTGGPGLAVGLGAGVWAALSVRGEGARATRAELRQRGERDGVGLAALGRTRGAEGSWARVGFSWARDLGWVSRGGGAGPGSRVGLLG